MIINITLTYVKWRRPNSYWNCELDSHCMLTKNEWVRLMLKWWAWFIDFERCCWTRLWFIWACLTYMTQWHIHDSREVTQHSQRPRSLTAAWLQHCSPWVAAITPHSQWWWVIHFLLSCSACTDLGALGLTLRVIVWTWKNDDHIGALRDSTTDCSRAVWTGNKNWFTPAERETVLSKSTASQLFDSATACFCDTHIQKTSFSFCAGLLFYQLFVFQAGDRNNANFDTVSSKRANFHEYSFLIKHTPKLIIFGTHNLQTFRHNILINKVLLMQFYLFNIRPKLHHRKLRKLCITLFQTFSTSPAASWCCCSSNLYLETLL